jgi:hypothetical protein
VLKAAGRAVAGLLAGAIVVCAGGGAARAQDLGHKTLGTIGLEAGSAPPPGLALSDRFAFYRADELRDRHGAVVPIDQLRLRVFANVIGVSAAIALPEVPALLLAATVAGPVAHVRLDSDDLRASVDRLGVTDVFVQPLKLAWHTERFDAVAGYALYIPTGLFRLRGDAGLTKGHFTHEFSSGGALRLGPGGLLFASALFSYELNLRKQGLDLTRGDTVQGQGGLGVKLLGGLVQAGVAGYALWQVEDDRGADLPEILRGARDRAFGIGPEVVVAVPPLRMRLRVRFEHELGIRSRPAGDLVLVGGDVIAWTPR